MRFNFSLYYCLLRAIIRTTMIFPTQRMKRLCDANLGRKWREEGWERFQNARHFIHMPSSLQDIYETQLTIHSIHMLMSEWVFWSLITILNTSWDFEYRSYLSFHKASCGNWKADPTPPRNAGGSVTWRKHYGAPFEHNDFVVHSNGLMANVGVLSAVGFIFVAFTVVLFADLCTTQGKILCIPAKF